MRKPINEDIIIGAFDRIIDKLMEKIEDKGELSFTSRHEILGVISEEFDEFKETVHNNSLREVSEEELIDIVIAVVWGLCSSEIGALDW